ncbi:MAG TPA: cysteine rich repeat-containing protein [Nitrospirota bacterium]|nr:cysteine rich repeat-containing protein [Nitrospirota bacterium]
MMRNAIVWVVVIGMVLVFGGVVSAQQKGPAEAVAQGIVDSVKKGCDKELKTYCKDVTPGEGRVLACLYAYEDKLSGQCEYALYDAAAQLERAVNALSYAVNECRDDLTKFCSDIKPGEGRLLQCIDKNDAKVSGRCKQALKDTGLKK